MLTTRDKYELPVAVAESPSELEKMTGIKRKSILSCISRGLKGYHRIEIDEKGEDNVRDQ